MRFVYIHTLWFGLWIADNAGLNVQAEAEIAKLLHLVEALMAHQADLAESMRAARTDSNQLAS